jgi:hypothetical protein
MHESALSRSGNPVAIARTAEIGASRSLSLGSWNGSSWPDRPDGPGTYPSDTPGLSPSMPAGRGLPANSKPERTYALPEPSASGPASLMREEQLHDIADRENEIQRIEFYGPLMDWQQRWATEVRTMFHLNCYRFKSLRTLSRKIKNMRWHSERELQAQTETRRADLL